MRNKAIALLCVLSVLGCSSNSEPKLNPVVASKSKFNPDKHARIRLHSIYGEKLIRPYSATDCDKWNSTRGQKTHPNSNTQLFVKQQNTVAGIPDTQYSLSNPEDGNEAFRGAYREYVVKGDMPLVLDALSTVHQGEYLVSCRIATSFTPKSGHDYEAYYVMTSFEGKVRSCHIEILALDSQPTENVMVATASITDRQSCTIPKWEHPIQRGIKQAFEAVSHLISE